MLLTTLLFDTHVLLSWDVDPGRLSDRAAFAVSNADELAVSGHTWYDRVLYRIDDTFFAWS